MPKKKEPKTDELLPCPLCGNPEPVNRGHGIECLTCGLWLGNGTTSYERGGVIKNWNTRTETKQP